MTLAYMFVPSIMTVCNEIRETNFGENHVSHVPRLKSQIFALEIHANLKWNRCCFGSWNHRALIAES